MMADSDRWIGLVYPLNWAVREMGLYIQHRDVALGSIGCNQYDGDIKQIFFLYLFSFYKTLPVYVLSIITSEPFISTIYFF